MANPAKDFTGERFGTRVVTGRAPDAAKSRNKRWHTICDCGAVGVHTADSLRRHVCRVCNPIETNDLTGQHFGARVVTGRGERTDGKFGRDILWHVVCDDCGREGNLPEWSLRTRGCYCDRRLKPRVIRSLSYNAVHQRTRKNRGPASQHVCVTCGNQAEEWAYDHLDPDELTGHTTGGPVQYSTKPEHYQPMCKPCHRTLDYKHAKGRG